MITLQSIFKKYGDEYQRRYPLNRAQRRAFNAICKCRTSEMGYHVNTCDQCEHYEISPNSCRNRHCPRCQNFAKEQWIKNQESYLLGVRYFHVVFTIPQELNTLMYHNQSEMYNLFFRAVRETLLELGADRKYVGATIGATCILHTWGQNLCYHPHIHCVIPAGGLKDDMFWVNSSQKFFIPVKVLSAKFRGKFMALFRESLKKLEFLGENKSLLETPYALDSFIQMLYAKNWITFAKKPYKNASCVLNYLGRYTHKIAISESRIISCEDGKVTFMWRDYRDKNKNKEMTLDVIEFMRRYMMHVLPKGFCKIRHIGILASRNKSSRIELCQRLTKSRFSCVKRLDAHEIRVAILGKGYNLCPACKVGTLSRASPEVALRLASQSLGFVA